MERKSVVNEVFSAITWVQEASGRTVVGIGPNTRPFRDVDGFDSLNGVEATVLLSDAVGRDLSDSVFIPKEGNRALSVGEIADNVMACIGGEQVEA